MSIQLKVPSLGESITQATIGAWLKREGDPVQADEPLVEVESEKATVALPAPAAGVLRRVLRNTGDTVAIGEVVGELEEGATAPAAKGNGAGRATQATPIAAAATPAATSTPAATPIATATQARTPTATPTATQAHSPKITRAPPSARRLMAEHGVSAEELQGSGPGGQVRKEDVLRAIEAAPAAAP